MYVCMYYSAYTYIQFHIFFSLGNSDDDSTGVIVGPVVGGIVGIILGAAILILTMIFLWCHCKMHKEENIPGSYI